ncbi:HdeD family acid-resistance protein [Afifella sp. H1R]|uniref:HdeD family acid-resistance protein n=1 Tax=Afifella sp. H1R TaxID=2908841 RepID=UPI001F371D93|nr:HdeD family acid-resistance protein [Afifella sp. H1R]MCF1502501.1 HdeD family acid-resistance protein [Afifella sp. H1R]
MYESDFGGLGPRDREMQETLAERWGWLVAFGAIALIGGLLGFIAIVTATVASVYLIGIMMLLSGFAEVAHGIQSRRWSRFFLWILIGALYVVAAAMIFVAPLFAAVILTWLLGVVLIFAGGVRTFLAFSMRPQRRWGYVLASGLLTILIGVVILVGWPASSLWALGIFLAVDLIVIGSAWIAMGLALRDVAYPRSGSM